MKKTFIHIFKEQKGIGLVEVIAALGISVVVITSLLSLTLFSLRTSLQSTLLLEATKAANTQMELLRAYRDLNAWDDFVSTVTGSTCTAGCFIDINTMGIGLGTSLPTYVGDTEVSTSFFATGDTSVVHITVQSTWGIGGQNKKTYVYTDFTNWQQK